MDFRLTDAQTALRDQMRAYLEAAHPPALLRALAAGTADHGPIWQGFVDMGLPGLLVPEADGGTGLSLLEGAVIAVELGRALVGGALADTALVAVPHLVRAGHTAPLAAIAGGGCVIALAHPINPWIANLGGADAVLTAAGLQPVPGGVVPLPSIDPLRDLYTPLPNTPHCAHMLNLGALMAAAQMLGAAERMLALATEYAKLRTQFGQPIGGFQAVKHLLATSAVRTDFARPVLWRAAMALDENQPHAAIHASHAKVAAGDAAMQAAETAIQVHGAMGYTYEVDLHFWMKRVWALAGAWGDRSFHQRRIDTALFACTLPTGPGATFTREDHHA